MTLRASALLIAGIFAVALSTQVATRLSAEALDVTVGVLCGMAASIPVSFGLMLALQRRQHEQEPEAEPEWRTDPLPASGRAIRESSPAQYQPARPPFPQVVVVAPPQYPFAGGYAQNNYGQNAFGQYGQFANYPSLAPGPEANMQERNWKIVGDEEE